MADVLIFDDDPSVGDLMGELLRGRGLTVSHFLSGAGVVQLVMENKPKLVILDIMMPGMDGLTACKTLKSNPATRGAKIAILTAKNYEEDQATAMRYGADLFLHKPFDPGAFAGSIGRVLGLPDQPAPAAPPAPPVVVTILPGAVVAETAGMLIVFDAGKGLKGLLERQTHAAPMAWFLISRYRPENSSEISAGALLLKKGTRVNVAGPDESESKLQQLAPAMCATMPGGARATPLLYPQREGEFALAPGIRAVSRLTQHAGTCLAYRVELQGRAIVYCPAHEIHPDLARLNKHEHAKFRDFFKGADLLLHGYRRSIVDESPKDGIGSGAWEPVVDLAAAAGVKRIALMPMADDTVTDGLPFRIEERLLAQNSELCFGVTRFNERVILQNRDMNILKKYEDHAYAALRFMTGWMFAFHGAQKILGLYPHPGMPPIAFPSQMWWGGMIELIGGLMIAIGFKTREAAFLSSGTMAVAYAQFHWKLQFNSMFWPAQNQGEMAVIYCFVFLLIACRGTGRWGFEKVK